jgi:hypothetical protein
MATFKESVLIDLDNETTTFNGALSCKSSLNACVDLFYKSCRGVENEVLVSLLEKAFWENSLVTLKIIAYCRDVRGGKGERSVGRQMFTWLANENPDYLVVNLDHYIKVYGRFDDVVALLGTNLEDFGIDLWVEQLKTDLEILKNENENENGISLAAKWIPSEHKSIDKKYNVVYKICKKLGVSKCQFRKVYLVPLRKKLDILETKMCESKWQDIDFEKVPSVAMKNHGKDKCAFRRHQLERFQEYLGKLKTGEAKVNAKDLFPHQIVAGYQTMSQVDQLLESQWNVFVENVQSNYDVSNTLVLSDVSGSMTGTPMDVSLALGLLVSQCSDVCWKDLVLTFESLPKFHNVKGDSLFDRINILRRAPWGGSTDFNAALQLVLNTATQNNIKQSDMPKRLIVVSDMQFDQAERGNFTTNYQKLQQMYTDSNYKIPHIVFWNVDGNTLDVPAKSTQENVSLVSGFSVAILKSVLGNEEITPVSTMNTAINDPRYNLVKVPDLW